MGQKAPRLDPLDPKEVASMPQRATDPTTGPTDKNGPEPAVIQALAQACEDFGAESVERLALFQAAIVASDLRVSSGESDGRLGVLAQNATWGPAAARMDPYTAATVFLREARRTGSNGGSARSSSRLAARIQCGPGAWRHATVRRAAERIIAGLAVVDLPVATGELAPVAPVAAVAAEA
jgi:hypothetical protein